jgi:hypothetical protein
LAGQKRKHEAPRPKTQEAAPCAAAEGIEGGIIDRGAGDQLIIRKRGNGRRVGRGLFVLDLVSSFVGHGSLVAIGQEMTGTNGGGRTVETPEDRFGGREARSILFDRTPADIKKEQKTRKNC